MTLHVVELARMAPQPWRNGGGVTRELLAWPLGASTDWLLRVSVAEIEHDGPFSPFPGVQRCFAVLEGAGVVLGRPGGDQALTPASPPLAFDGAEAPSCRLLDGPTRDLNLMARQTAGRLRMGPAQPGERAPEGARWCGLYAATALLLDPANTPPVALPAHALAWCDTPGARWGISPTEGRGAPHSRAWWLVLEAAA
ncbi:MAG: HutD family protein [Burkholderiaceae bacterium]